MSPPKLATRTIDDLILEDERSFRHVGLYADLKAILRQDRFVFRVLPDGPLARWDHALLLNLTFWADTAAGDILVDDHLDADVLAHAAWHHLAARHLRSETRLSAEALLLGEAIASAFDLYLVGRLLGHAPDAAFLETQVPAMTDVALNAGLSEAELDAMLRAIERDPDRAFEDLRQLLYDAALALFACPDAEAALAVLARFEDHRFAALLHRYELSNWVLSTRAQVGRTAVPDQRTRAVDAALREAPCALTWLTRAWVEPALAGR